MMHAAKIIAELPADAAPPAPWPEIGRMIADGGLEPTPVVFEICYQYLLGRDPDLATRVDAAIRRYGGFNRDAIKELVQDRPAPDEVSAMISTAHRHIEQIGGLLHRSTDQTQSYGSALESRANSLAGDDRLGPVIQDLMSLTRTMIEQNREVHAQLRETGDEVRQMRERLEDARRVANTDALTGLPNRRALEAELKAAMAKIKGLSAQFALAICDIDHFKRFNDEHGHPVGDGVLKLVASRLAANGQNGRVFVSRYGGEEFVMLFEGMSAAEAARAIDTIRGELSARDLSLSNSGKRLGKLSFSAGVASFIGHRSASSVLKSADAALYEAKRAGRNRVCIAQ